jgi:hypothetical protein
MSKLCLATSALTVGSTVKNSVNGTKSNNQCTLEQIRAKPVYFCNFAQNRWFCVFLTEMRSLLPRSFCSKCSAPFPFTFVLHLHAPYTGRVRELEMAVVSSSRPPIPPPTFFTTLPFPGRTAPPLLPKLPLYLSPSLVWAPSECRSQKLHASGPAPMHDMAWHA